jgi:transcription initiation factor TFIIB
MANTDSNSSSRATRPARPESPSTTPPECPECSGTVHWDGQEAVCGDCGLVLKTDDIDRGPEWRDFNDSGPSKSRVGAPRTETRHDHGLSTTIGWKDKDGYGKTLSSDQRKRAARLRKQHSQTKIRSSSEQNKVYGLTEIRRLCSSLGLSDPVKESASRVFQQAHDAGIASGRSLEAVATAALYTASRIHESPRTLATLTTASRLQHRRPIFLAYKSIIRRFELAVPLVHPRDIVPQVITDLDVVDSTAQSQLRQDCRNLVTELEGTGVFTGSGSAPNTLAGALVYVAACKEGLAVSQTAVGTAACCSTTTIRVRGREIVAESAQLPEWDSLPTAKAPPADDYKTVGCTCGQQFTTRTGMDIHVEDKDETHQQKY